MSKNPLAEAQRESAGASTFGKYNFQFHWALCEIIKKHKSKNEYALLIEYHEDVVIASSLDPENAQFEFYQVKNQGATYTPSSLTKRKEQIIPLKAQYLVSCLVLVLTQLMRTELLKLGWFHQVVLA
ncbi:DUF4297 domain-containing protein [Proteus mirabilis]|nr:dsDNA nuclease domain-containing protein [Proteus mirabilis]MBS3865275.1 DUF4297 domain-containing protein [Proteus mirabilis]